ncbi:cytidylyltransferase domain-containing protein [Mucilaginibacter sp. OK098]|uniref:acylneuraminate cytidylyltransferase family protein n=1 Tax=Mucilaginibacter sp. OK098 TaxID=1855297 RepID=UPI00091DC8E5|nr:acylneuraminate cytidylyltransferase family protein [Mucilaginibacter sp. OK098]SHL93111.1 CMP-N,N'-diacetyllegionaminic acid synthase [Mucilaginibacter sp. OK098]
MSTSKNILAIIPARGGSKGISNKNIRDLNNKPLIAHPIDTAFKSNYINRVVVSTDNELIKNVAIKYNAEVVDRPDELASDSSLVIDTIRHTVQYLAETENYKTDIIVLLECTSPIKSVIDIDLGIESILEEKADSSTSFKESPISPNRLWRIDENSVAPYIENAKPFLPRQQQPVAYQLTGQFYALSNKILQENPGSISIMLGKVYPIKSTTAYVIDIDEEIDFLIAEEIFKKII